MWFDSESLKPKFLTQRNKSLGKIYEYGMLTQTKICHDKKGITIDKMEFADTNPNSKVRLDYRRLGKIIWRFFKLKLMCKNYFVYIFLMYI